MKLLALDCSRSIGWCFFADAKAKPTCRTWKAADTWASDLYGSYFSEFEVWLNDALMRFTPDVLAFESPILMPRVAGRGTDERQVRRMVGVAAIIEKVAYDRRVRCFEVNNRVAKAFVGLGPYKDKNGMIVAMTQKGFSVADSHQSDACAVALVVYDQIGGGSGFQIRGIR